jgi:hypothetical protein
MFINVKKFCNQTRRYGVSGAFFVGVLGFFVEVVIHVASQIIDS